MVICLKSDTSSKYTGGTTTPDFVYMIETDEQDAKYLIVETKAENMRLGDKSIGEIQKNSLTH